MEITQEQLQEMIDKAVSSVKADILLEVDTKNQGVAASISRKLKSLETQPESTKEVNENQLTLQSLEDQVKSLQADLKAKEQQAFNAERNAKISELVSQSDVNAKGILSRQIETLYGDKLVKENGKWFVQDNDTVKDFDTTFNEYLTSDEGNFFLPANKTVGSGSNRGEKLNTINAPTTEDILLNAFS